MRSRVTVYLEGTMKFATQLQTRVSKKRHDAVAVVANLRERVLRAVETSPREDVDHNEAHGVERRECLGNAGPERVHLVDGLDDAR